MPEPSPTTPATIAPAGSLEAIQPEAIQPEAVQPEAVRALLTHLAQQGQRCIPRSIKPLTGGVS
ncbi:MAG: hypothetical protein ACKOBM_14785, partial [Gammaproteobacteria bacterium]